MVASLGFAAVNILARQQVCWAAEQDDGPVVLYGFSMGGAAMLRAAATEDLPIDGMIVESVYDRLPTTVAHRFEGMGLPSFPGTELLMFWGSIELGAAAWRIAPVDDAIRVHTPTLLMAGTADARVHASETEAIAASLSNGRYVPLHGAGHAPGFKTKPEVWRTAVDRFLLEVLSSR